MNNINIFYFFSLLIYLLIVTLDFNENIQDIATYIIIIISFIKIIQLNNSRKIISNIIYRAKNLLSSVFGQKLSYHQQFAAYISHEFRNMIQSIYSLSLNAESNWENLSEEKRYNNITEISKISKKMLALANQILNISKFSAKHKLSLELCDIEIMLKEIIREIQLSYPGKENEVNIKSNIKSDEHHIYCDAILMEQLLRNIIGNAYKFTDKGSVNVSFEKQKDFAVFEVIDTGIGIQESEIKQIFGDYERGANSKNKLGTGLGLSISKEIIKAHKGEINAGPNLDEHGSKFIIKIPNLENEFIEQNQYIKNNNN